MFTYRHHPHTSARNGAAPVRTVDLHRAGSTVQRFNTKVALAVTRVVGSMWCAYAFAAFDLISLPAAIRGGSATIVSWIAQTFLQLVLLSIIMVGQDVQSRAADARSAQTFADAEAILHEVGQMQLHLRTQDAQAAAGRTAVQAIADHFGIELPPSARDGGGAA